MGAGTLNAVEVNDALLREIVEISSEVELDRILRKATAAARRLEPSSEVTFSIDVNNQVIHNGTASEISDTIAKIATFAFANVISHDLADRLKINEERLRIARDLHDRVLQRIFATGLSLEGALRKAVVEDVIKALKLAIVDLDETVGQIRSTVHSLKGPTSSLRQRILTEIESARLHWGLVIDFNMSGPIDSVIPKEYAEDIVAVTSELLNNCGKHAKTRKARYELNVTGNSLEISVTNKSTEENQFKFGSGLNNLSERAAKYGGDLLVENLSSGLKVSWKIAI